MHSRLQLSLFAPGFWTICYEPLVSGSFCSLFGVWRNAGSTMDTCSRLQWLLEVFTIST